ncbi:putative transporter subunit: ATP-binding component of ABC superfamily transporter [uncultured Pleomorphomonas sp.]|uniref:Putative transporter subunit: ATP-binding component of ABC superfamily transporter n=1 Tax=uncultured Pleomorphomonas sp. TaxID=442121 RepID=A0A212LMS9_9HYPH|nr:ABC transporter ATP-binding protein [uncultured Pleomorphomonas sp.]SCM78827.1 putative transporter subunit: ATP-binding component of ABC superfamily transporter [uncultured Pleomorphomonas sp.]
MIELSHLTKVYGDIAVVNDVDMHVEAGTITVIVGTSGSGKSTLLRMVNRLVEPTEGRILVQGSDVSKMPAHELRRSIGYAIQNHGLFPHWTVARNIATVPMLLGWDRRKVAARVEELMELFQLDHAQFAGRYPHELSGGQQQRVGVARAMAAKPALLLMDEPFGALDPIIRGKAQADLKAIQRRTGTTILLVTHDMDEAIHLGDRIAVMDGGNLKQYAPAADILARPADAFVDDLIGAVDRPFHYLTLGTIGAAVEPGEAGGAPLAADASLYEGLGALLWSGRKAAPVVDAAGAPLGRVSLDSIADRAARPR